MRTKGLDQLDSPVERPAKRRCGAEKEDEKSNSDANANDSDAMDIGDSGDSMDPQNALEFSGNSGSTPTPDVVPRPPTPRPDGRGLSAMLEDDNEMRLVGQSTSDAVAGFSGKPWAEQGAKPKEVVDNGNQTSTESSDEDNDTHGLTLMPRSFSHAMKVKKEQRDLFDQEVLQLFTKYVDFMIAYAVEKKMNKILLFEKTSNEPPEVEQIVESGKSTRGKRTRKEKDLMFED